MAGSVQVEGLDQLKRQMHGLTQSLRTRVLRNALRAGAREVARDARSAAPVLNSATRSPYRAPGTVRRAISVRASRRDRRAGDVGVFVNVRPAKAADRGARSPRDPFYWRFLEFGTNKMRAQPFLRPAAQKLPQALEVFKVQLARWISKVDSSGSIQP